MFQNQGVPTTILSGASAHVVGDLKETDVDGRLTLMGRIVADCMGLANVLREAWSDSSWDDLLAFCIGTDAKVGSELYNHFLKWCAENGHAVPQSEDDEALKHLGRRFFDIMVGLGKAPH